MLPVLREHHYTYCIPVISEVVREIGDKDREYFYKNRKLDVWE